MGASSHKPRLRALLLDLDGTLMIADGGDWRLNDGAAELLDFARAHGLALAVVTSAGRQSTEDFLARCGIRELFGAVVTAHDVLYSKPAPEPYRTALESLDAAPEEAAAIEDSESGVRSATRAGVRTIVLDPGGFLAGLRHWRLIAGIGRLDDAIGVLRRVFLVDGERAPDQPG